jgi:toxin CcdB
MAQFDVHTNRGRNRAAIPYLVNVQSRRYDRAGSRVVAPLLRLPKLDGIEPALMPKFEIRGEQLVLSPLHLFTAPASGLGAVVASLAADEDASRIVAAIDALITQAYG